MILALALLCTHRDTDTHKYCRMDGLMIEIVFYPGFSKLFITSEKGFY